MVLAKFSQKHIEKHNSDQITERFKFSNEEIEKYFKDILIREIKYKKVGNK